MRWQGWMWIQPVIFCHGLRGGVPVTSGHFRRVRSHDIDNLSRNQDIAVGLQVILKPRARPTPTWTSMPERTLDFEF